MSKLTMKDASAAPTTGRAATTDAPPQEAPGLLLEFLHTALEYRWVLAASVTAALVCAAIYLFFAVPQYESDVLIQVEERSRGLLSHLEDIPGLPQGTTPADTEIQVLRSRTLLGTVVDSLQLQLVARPRWVPLVGAAIARRRDPENLSPPWPGLASYAWGGERIRVSRFDVPAALEGRRFRLIAGTDGRYTLKLDGRALMDGEVGRPAATGAVTPRSDRVELFVEELSARPDTAFELVKVPRPDVVAALQGDLAISELGKKTGVIRMALSGPDPAKLAATLDAISNTYLRQNVERKSAEAEKTLAFIEAQLPVLRSNVEAAEVALSAYRSKVGAAIDLSLESKAMLERSADVERKATELALQRAEISQRFQPDHPIVRTLREKEARVKAELDEVNASIRRLPEAELNSVRLVRDLKVANELYVLLLNKAQELRVVKSGTTGNVRIIDVASLPRRPVAPRPFSVVMFALLMGSGAGLAIAYGLKTMRRTLEDVARIEEVTGLSVYAAIPHSDAEERASREGQKSGRVAPLAHTDGSDVAVEGFRSLRTSILFTLSEASSNIIVLSGPTPGIGKSFVSANLAWVLAEIGHRVVVVDADLRRGRLHRYFGADKSPGLADCIQGTVSIADVLRDTDNPSLKFIPMGKAPPNPTELLSSQRFQELTRALSERFGILLLDTPPLLAVTDAAIVARSAAINLMVVRAGRNTASEVTGSIKHLAQGGAATTAIILNDVRPRMGYGQYGYTYRYQPSE